MKARTATSYSLNREFELMEDIAEDVDFVVQFRSFFPALPVGRGEDAEFQAAGMAV